MSSKNFLFQNSRPLPPEKLSEIYRTLRKAFGHQNWWPGETAFEVMVGAILTQNTAWTNVEKAIANLKKAGVLDAKKMRVLPERKLARLIRPSGYFNIKANRLKHFLSFLFEKYGGDLIRMKKETLSLLRPKLLAVKGIGPETADSILLYALGKPSFVIDAYTIRIFSRHRLKVESLSSLALDKKLRAFRYSDWQRVFTESLPPRTDLYNDFHAQIVHLAKNFCLSSKPHCESCPLRSCL